MKITYLANVRMTTEVVTKSPVRLLAIYRGNMSENRGTPIRVRSLLERVSRDDRFSLTVASWDEKLPFLSAHLYLTNNHLEDIIKIIRLVRRERIDIVMGHTMATWYYLMAVKIFTRAKIVLEMHGFIEVEARFYGSIGSIRYTIERLGYRCFYPLCSLITTCSENAAEILGEWNNNVIPIYGGVDTALFNPDVSPGQFFIHAKNEIVIGYAGNVRKWQGVPFLLNAFAKIKAEHPNYRLVILSSEGRKIPDTQGVTVIDGIPHESVPSFLAACDILVIPRVEDVVSRISFPSKLPEYLAMGKPVVASATSDAHRIITDGIDGFIFSPGNIDAFCEILYRLENANLRKNIGKAAYEMAVRNFSWDRQVAILTKHLLTIA